MTPTFDRRPRAVLFALICTAMLAGPAAAADADVRPKDGYFVIGASVNSVHVDLRYPFYYWAEVVDADPAHRVERSKLSVAFFGGNESGIKSFRSELMFAEIGGTALYAFRLPPGKYRIDRLVGSWNQGDVVYTEWLPFGERFPEFTVEAGRLTDGGTILIQAVGERAIINRVPSFAGQLDFAKEAFGSKLELDPALPTLEWGGWEEGSRGVMTLVQLNAPAVGPFFGTRDGQVLVPGKHGQLLRYEGDAKWSTRGTGIAGTLYSVNEGREGRLMVGGEFGAVAFADGLFADWKVEQLPAGTGIVHGIVETPQGELVALAGFGVRKGSGGFFAVSMPGDTKPPAAFRLYKRALDGKWSVLREIALPKDDGLFAFADGDRLVVGFGPERYGVWSGGDGAWAERDYKGQAIRRAPDGTWLKNQSSASGNEYFSRDQGATWTEIERGRNPQLGKNAKAFRIGFLGTPVPMAEPGHWAVLGYQLGKSKASGGLYRTTDGGLSWALDKGASGVCVPAHRMARIGEAMWMACQLTQIFGQDAPGAEWKAQREFVAPPTN